MKTISSALASHISGEVTTLATCWKLTPRARPALGFTDHDRDLVFEGLTYSASTGFTPSAISAAASLAVDNLEVEGMLQAGALTEAEIMAGVYDFAEIEVFMVNYNDLSQGSLKLRRGWLGEVSCTRGRFVAEVRGLAQGLSQTLGELYGPACRARFGDSRCKVNPAAHTVTGGVDGVDAANPRQIFADAARLEATAHFTGGAVTFTDGDNAGLSMEVKEHRLNAAIGGVFTLALPLPYPIAAGDAYSLVAGCDKTLATCAGRFGNAVNFRGEPHIPGLDRLLQTAGTR